MRDVSGVAYDYVENYCALALAILNPKYTSNRAISYFFTVESEIKKDQNKVAAHSRGGRRYSEAEVAEVYELHTVDKLTYKEIAKRLGYTVKDVHYRIVLARQYQRERER